jgi:hypothetical protein
VIDMETANKLAGEFVASAVEQDELGMACARLALDDLDPDDLATWRLGVYLLAIKALRELAELQDCSAAEAVERLA